MPGFKSPDVRNYQVGKGIALFTPEDQITGALGTQYALGNCPKLVYTPNVTVLPHMSAMAGTKVQDFSVITQKGGTVQVDMEEQTANNLSLFFLGSVDDTNPAAPTVGIFNELQQIRGQLDFYQTNDVGPRWHFLFTRVLIAPQGNFNPISDGYNAMTVTMTHVIDDNGLFGTMALQPDINAVVPTNLLLPFITGPLFPGEDPAFAQVGEVMRLNIGAWTGVQSFSFQWYSAAGIISGATSNTYIPVVGDVGNTLTVHVTGTNSTGSTTVISTATQAVHA